jgi:hypothetical protein
MKAIIQRPLHATIMGLLVHKIPRHVTIFSGDISEITFMKTTHG